MKIFNWGIIGPGRIARKFAADLALLPNARLYAVGSRSAERAAEFAREYSIPNHFDSYEALADCPGLDLVYIATPHSGHCEAAILCLERGLAVLCEKPLALNLAEAQRMAASALQNNAFLMEALWTHFLPPTLQVLEWIETGAIGQIQAVKADFGFPAQFDPAGRLFDPALGGGALLDIGIYPVFLALLCLGTPQRIEAASAIGRTGVDEDTGMVFQYKNGAMAHLHASLRYHTAIEAFVYGDKGTIQMHSRWHHTRQLTLTPAEGNPLVMQYDYPGLGYQFEAAEAMRCIEAGLKESPLMPVQFSLDLMETLDRVRKIASTTPRRGVSFESRG